ncbi:DNA-processing protein DprA [Cytobacillus depressus]|uniref:DNA-processing protein DprA n=1 Tax=Cytobacillus depressus TaxID=1602942 RepID=A0A6L3V6J7_9BACI|nr:DNA-protecting protein DprA [Cytobacillus depressus]KAB2336768.1 DNA-processing protein DprA [Cytobacillus depressus]
MDVYWVWLSRLKYVGPVLQKQLIAHFHCPKLIYEAGEESLSGVPKMTRNALESIGLNRSLKETEMILMAAEKSGVRLLLYNDVNYPDFAKECKESPVVLYYRGQLKPIKNAVGVVGARWCTSYGKKIAKQIGEELARLNIPVNSGFAKGIDSYAQAACARHGGYTISFLGCGPDICYPTEQRQLYHEFLEKGNVFISQFPPGTAPNPKFFLSRNALISAWSTELVIVEAGEQSGALTTVDFAIKNNKRVYAVPNHIGVQEGVGTNRLLSEGISPYLGIQSLQCVKDKRPLDVELIEKVKREHPILKFLSESPITIQQLSHLAKLSEDQLMDQLLDLELTKEIIMRGNLVYGLH